MTIYILVLLKYCYAIHPLIFSYDPAAFDEQTAYTLKAYRGEDWNTLKAKQRPDYGNNPREEAERAEEV